MIKDGNQDPTLKDLYGDGFADLVERTIDHYDQYLKMLDNNPELTFLQYLKENSPLYKDITK